MITATERAIQINAATAARCAARGVECWGELVTDAAHWAEYGIHTGAELDRYLAWCDYVDVYKEFYNIKPRWTRPEDRTAEEWSQMSKDLWEQSDNNWQ